MLSALYCLFLAENTSLARKQHDISSTILIQGGPDLHLNGKRLNSIRAFHHHWSSAYSLYEKKYQSLHNGFLRGVITHPLPNINDGLTKTMVVMTYQCSIRVDRYSMHRVFAAAKPTGCTSYPLDCYLLIHLVYTWCLHLIQSYQIMVCPTQRPVDTYF